MLTVIKIGGGKGIQPEFLLREIVKRAGVRLPVEVLAPLRPEPFHYEDVNKKELEALLHTPTPALIRTGTSEGRRVAFVFFESPTKPLKVRFPEGFTAGTARDLLSGDTVTMTATPAGHECTLTWPHGGIAVIVEGE